MLDHVGFWIIGFSHKVYPAQLHHRTYKRKRDSAGAFGSLRA